METLGSYEMSVLTRATRRNISEDDILHSHRRENLKFYIKHNVSETGSLYDFRSEKGDTYSVGPLERANLNQINLFRHLRDMGSFPESFSTGNGPTVAPTLYGEWPTQHIYTAKNISCRESNHDTTVTNLSPVSVLTCTTRGFSACLGCPQAIVG
jgi:hypothetical protein